MSTPDLIIIKRWTWQRYALAASLAVFIIAIFTTTGYLLGNRSGTELRDSNKALMAQVEQLNQELETARKQLVMTEQLSKVEQEANRQAGTSLDSQQQRIRELERELQFFRNILAPEESEKGLQISRFTWEESEDGQIGWQVSLIQAGSQGATISGTVGITVNALKNNEPVQITVTDDKDSDRFNYRFRYFQHLTGTVLLDKELVPVSAEVVVMPTAKGQQIVRQLFPWQLDEEKLANVQ